MLSQAPDTVTIGEIETRIHLLSKQDEERNDVIKMMVRKLYNYEKDMHGLKRDLSAQTDSRIMYQERNDELQLHKKKLENMVNKDPYVAVLVDGDGAIFGDSFLEDPATGATEAAQKLKQDVRKHLRLSWPDISEDVPIFARVFASLHALATALMSSGVTGADDMFFDFTERFTNSCAEFDFINVGRGKENADSKMRSMLNHFFKDRRCKRIYFVACHDAGYVHDLRPYVDEHAATEQRIVLVETTPAHTKIKALGLPVIQFGGLFRSKPLPSRTDLSPRNQSSAVMAAAQRPKTPLPASPRVIASSNGGVPINHQVSYAKAGGQEGHQNFVITKRSAASTRTVNFNRDGHRLDTPMKLPSSALAQASYTRKAADAKPKALCNAFYLNGNCPWKTTCDKEHGVKLSVEELVIHRFRARTAVCYSGKFCDDTECVHGHHCPWAPYCAQNNCKWKDTSFGNLHLDKAGMEPM